MQPIGVLESMNEDRVSYLLFQIRFFGCLVIHFKHVNTFQGPRIDFERGGEARKNYISFWV